jgi:hypothetical protein
MTGDESLLVSVGVCWMIHAACVLVCVCISHVHFPLMVFRKFS